jgi:hypothetical protein
MEFRIAPILLACINLFLIGFNVYQTYVASTIIHTNLKMLGVMLIIILLAMSTFRSHDFFSKTFKVAFYLIWGLGIIGWGVLCVDVIGRL